MASRQAWRPDPKTDIGTGQLASDGPDLAPIPEVVVLELPASGPSAAAVGPSDDGTPIRPSLHGGSDTDGLVGRTRDYNLELIADLKFRLARRVVLLNSTVGFCARRGMAASAEISRSRNFTIQV